MPQQLDVALPESPVVGPRPAPGPAPAPVRLVDSGPVRPSPPKITSSPRPAPATRGTAQPVDEAGAGSWLVPLAVLVVGMFMSVLDTSIVNVALPTIQIDLGISASD